MLSKCSDEVHLVCQESKCGYSELSNIDNLHIHDYSAKSIRMHIIKAFPRYFTRFALMEYSEVIRRKKFGPKYIKDCIRLITVGDYIYRKLLSITANNSTNDDNWIIDSYWFSNSAYAVARMKKKKPQYYCFTRAHSFEIDPIKNKFYFAGAKNYVQKYIDEILFISENGKQFYLENIIGKYKYFRNVATSEKCKVFRLGTLKSNSCISDFSHDGILRILSCSRIDIEKRVDLIAKMLLEWKGCPVEWTHFGGGDASNILAIATKLDSAKFKICIKGFCSNDAVHQFFCENSIDVFINVSSAEGVPVSIMEAQSYGIPVIATDVGGVSEIVNETNGVLLSANPTSEEIIDAINRFNPYVSDERFIVHTKECAFKNWNDKYSEITNDSIFTNHITNMLQGIIDEYKDI